MTKRRRVPEVLWKLFQNRARTLAETLLSFIPPPTVPYYCCKYNRNCLHCLSLSDRMSFLVRKDDPSEYRKLLHHCFVVVSDNAPSLPPFDQNSRYPQTEFVTMTIEMILSKDTSTNNLICTGYNKRKRKRTTGVVEALASSTWGLLKQRVGDALMFHLFSYSSIFIPLNRKNHRQVTGIAINDLGWQHLRKRKNQNSSSGVSKRNHKADHVSMDISSCHEDSTIDVDISQLTQNRARTLAETLLSLIPPPTGSCYCKQNPNCLRCLSLSDRMSFLLRKDNPSEYCKLLHHCFVVVSDNAPPPPPFDQRRYYPQIEFVRRTIEIILYKDKSTKNLICTGYNKRERTSVIFEALSSSSWSLLRKRVGDALMFHLFSYSSIFIPLNRNKHRQVTGIAINDLGWQHLRKRKNQKSSSGVSKRHHKADHVSMDISSCHEDSTSDVDISQLTQNRARTLAETLLSLIPPVMGKCHCKRSCDCLCCHSEGDHMSFLLTEDDHLDYCNLLNHCLVVISDNAPSPLPFDYHSRYPQIEIVRRTIEIILSDNNSTKNTICTDYNMRTRSSTVLETLTTSSWSLLLKRVGDGLMFHLLKHSSIFMPVDEKKYHQVAGIAINDSCWQHLKHTSDPKNPQPASENGVVSRVTHSRKRCRKHDFGRKRKRMKLSKQYTCATKSSSSEEKMKSLCSCCSVWKTLRKVPTQTQIDKRLMLYKLERTSSVLPGKHVINSLDPNVSGANSLFRNIFGLTDVYLAQCSHSNDTCANKTTCLYHSLHEHLMILIQKAIHCPRLKILKKHILDQNSIEGESSTSVDTINQSTCQDISCSKHQVASFIWTVCMSIIPAQLLGNLRVLRKNIFKFIRLRIYEKFSMHQCMYKLKPSDFQFLSGNNSVCNSSMNQIWKRNVLERWIYWLFSSVVFPLLQANFYITESDNGNLQVSFYEKSAWGELMKTSVASLKDECYKLVSTDSVKRILDSRSFGFSRVRFRPKGTGIRPLANLKLSSRLQYSHFVKHFMAVNIALRELHVALKDVQLKNPEKLGSSVFSYNEVHKQLRSFLSQVKSGSNTLPEVYIVVAHVKKAYDSIDQDKLLHVMKDVIVDDHDLHETHQITASDRHFQICPYINSCKQFRSYIPNRSSHSVFVDQGSSRKAKKVDLHDNLVQHVKNNLLFIGKRFYQQKVGIPQGSILSSLLCSFYFGHMENTTLVPFLDKVTKSESADKFDYMLLRFIDDFLFISASKKLASGFFTRLERGFSEYNCNMNEEKNGLSFDSDYRSQSNRLYFGASGNKFLRWSGLLINCKTLEVQADYTRYLGGHLRSTLTVSWHGNPGQQFRKKVCDYLRPKCHAIFYDSNINSPAVVRLNIYQVFLLCAMKFHCYVCELSDICSFDSGSCLDIICNSLRYMYRLLKIRVHTLLVDPGLRPILKVKRKEVEWLGLKAYVEVLKRKQSRYNDLIHLLELNLKSGNIESSDLKFAVDESNSSVLWKIKY